MFARRGLAFLLSFSQLGLPLSSRVALGETPSDHNGPQSETPHADIVALLKLGKMDLAHRILQERTITGRCNPMECFALIESFLNLSAKHWIQKNQSAPHQADPGELKKWSFQLPKMFFQSFEKQPALLAVWKEKQLQLFASSAGLSLEKRAHEQWFLSLSDELIQGLWEGLQKTRSGATALAEILTTLVTLDLENQWAQLQELSDTPKPFPSEALSAGLKNLRIQQRQQRQLNQNEVNFRRLGIEALMEVLTLNAHSTSSDIAGALERVDLKALMMGSASLVEQEQQMFLAQLTKIWIDHATPLHLDFTDNAPDNAEFVLNHFMTEARRQTVLSLLDLADESHQKLISSTVQALSSLNPLRAAKLWNELLQKKWAVWQFENSLAEGRRKSWLRRAVSLSQELHKLSDLPLEALPWDLEVAELVWKQQRASGSASLGGSLFYNWKSRVEKPEDYSKILKNLSEPLPDLWTKDQLDAAKKAGWNFSQTEQVLMKSDLETFKNWGEFLGWNQATRPVNLGSVQWSTELRSQYRTLLIQKKLDGHRWLLTRDLQTETPLWIRLSQRPVTQHQDLILRTFKQQEESIRRLLTKLPAQATLRELAPYVVGANEIESKFRSQWPELIPSFEQLKQDAVEKGWVEISYATLRDSYVHPGFLALLGVQLLPWLTKKLISKKLSAPLYVVRRWVLPYERVFFWSSTAILSYGLIHEGVKTGFGGLAWDPETQALQQALYEASSNQSFWSLDSSLQNQMELESLKSQYRTQLLWDGTLIVALPAVLIGGALVLSKYPKMAAGWRKATSYFSQKRNQEMYRSFEALGIKSKPVWTEAGVHKAALERLQEIIELGLAPREAAALMTKARTARDTLLRYLQRERRIWSERGLAYSGAFKELGIPVGQWSPMKILQARVLKEAQYREGLISMDQWEKARSSYELLFSFIAKASPMAPFDSLKIVGGALLRPATAEQQLASLSPQALSGLLRMDAETMVLLPEKALISQVWSDSLKQLPTPTSLQSLTTRLSPSADSEAWAIVSKDFSLSGSSAGQMPKELKSEDVHGALMDLYEIVQIPQKSGSPMTFYVPKVRQLDEKEIP